MASKSNPVSTIEAIRFCKALDTNKHGRYHARNGMKRNVRHYAAFKVKDALSGTMEGHVCDRAGFDIKFVCLPGGKTHGYHQISITPGIKGWGGSFTPDSAVRIVEVLLWRAIQNSKHTGPIFHNKNKDGFYLEVTSKNRPVSANGERCLQKAADTKYITDNFQKTCLEWRISMKESVAA